MRRFVLLLALAPALTLAADPPPALRPAPQRVRLEATWSTSFSSSEHRLRFMIDEAALDATFDVAAVATGTVEATPAALSVKRTKRAKVSGFFSDSNLEARGGIAWTRGQPDPPPAWRLAVDARGFTSGVAGGGARWSLEGWLDGADRRSDEDARLRRLVHSTDLGTLFGAPPLPAGGDRYEVALPLVAGESGLTNKLVELRLVFDLTVTRAERLLRIAGPLARVEVVRGAGKGGGPDEWIDHATRKRALAASGELSGDFDPATGRWRTARSRVVLEHEGRFDGGAGRARYERNVGLRPAD